VELWCRLFKRTPYSIKSEWEVRAGNSPEVSFAKAFQYFRQAEQIKRAPILLQNRAVHRRHVAQYLWWQGKEYIPQLELAYQETRKAIITKVTPDSSLDMAAIKLQMASSEFYDGRLDRDALNLAKRHLEDAMSINPSSPVLLLNLAKLYALETHVGGRKGDLAFAQSALAKLNKISPNTAEALGVVVIIELAKFCQHPSWHAYLALEKLVQAGLKHPNPDFELHLIAFGACRAALEKGAPGAVPEIWKQRMKEHIRKAKEQNPLVGPLADHLLESVIEKNNGTSV